MKHLKYFETQKDKDDFHNKILWIYMKNDCSVNDYLNYLNSNIDFINRMRKKVEFITQLYNFSICNNYKHIFVRNNKLLIKVRLLLDLIDKYKIDDIEGMISYMSTTYFFEEKENIIERKKFFEDLILYFINKFSETISILNNLEILESDGKKVVDLGRYSNDYSTRVNIDVNIKFANFLMNSKISKFLYQKTIDKFNTDILELELFNDTKKYNL